MEIILIVSVSRDGVIGKEGGIPWNLKEDLKFFREENLQFPSYHGKGNLRIYREAIA